MNVRQALKALAGLDSHSPLAEVRDQIVAKARTREAERMEAARQRSTIQGGAGPLLSVLQRRLAEYAAGRLVNNAAPAITCADLHTVLKQASAMQGGRDKGLSRAATHAYHLWTKEPTGSLSVGDVARIRTHYQSEFPRSRVGSVIDSEVPKVGFNTLPVRELTRIASQVHRAGGTQAAYEEAVRMHGLDQQTPHAFRCRAFVRSMLEGVAPEAEQERTASLAERVDARLATDDDPVLSRFAQFVDMDMDMDMESEPEGEAVEEHLESPITGEPLKLELEAEPEPEPVDDMPMTPLPSGMEVMGQLDDFAPESTVIMEDPTDPEGGELELTVRPVEDAGPQPEPEPEPEPQPEPDDEEPGMMLEAADMPKCSEDHDHDDACYEDKQASLTHYAVYASVNGRLSDQPIDTFAARGMSDALSRIAGHGVRGHVHGDPRAIADEAYIALDNGNFLHVVAGAEPELQGRDEAFQPDVHEQMPDSMPSVDSDIMVGDETMGEQAHPHQHIASAVVVGKIAKRAGWQMQVNGDAQVELYYQGKRKKQASLAFLDDVVEEFVSASRPKPPEPLKYAAHRNTETGDYVVVTDVPKGVDGNELQYNAKRMLSAVQKVIPRTRGMLRKDGQLQLEFSAGEPELGRVRRILEDQYRAKEYVVQAQMLDMPPSPGSAAQEGLIQPTPTDATQSPQNSAAPAGTVTPPQPMQPQQPQQPEGSTYVGPAQQPALAAPAGAPAQPQAKAGEFIVHYKTPDGQQSEAPVQAKTAAIARELFARFNDDCEIVRVAQLEMPGEPIGGDEMEPLPVEDMLMGAEPEIGMMGAGGLSPEETEAVHAALTHYRNQGLGPATALDQLMSQYSDLLNRFGDKTDAQRHEVEAEAMKMAADIWTKPAMLDKQGQFDPDVHTQQPDAVVVPADLGEDSEADDAATDAVEAPKVNTQVPMQSQPGTSDSVHDNLGDDSETRDVGSFGAPKPKAHPDQQPQKGESHPSTEGPAAGLGTDSETDPKVTKGLDDAAAKANDALRSK